MKLCVTPFQVEDITTLANAGADIFIVGNKEFANRLVDSFDLDDIKKAISLSRKLDKELFVNVNFIAHHDDLEPLSAFLDELKTAQVDGILFSDLSVYQLAKKKDMIDKLIYHPETLVTNFYDSHFWQKQGIKGVIIAKEITLEDINLITSKKQGKIGIVGHGQLNMFHSRRPLIENFMKYNEQDYEQIIASKNLRLVEELRNEVYPVVQDNHGTHIFRDKTMESYLEILELNNLDYFIIDGLFRDRNYLLETTKNYHKILETKNIEYAKELREQLKDSHDQGFYYKKTVYDKF